jgi:hypothetical protein
VAEWASSSCPASAPAVGSQGSLQWGFVGPSVLAILSPQRCPVLASARPVLVSARARSLPRVWLTRSTLDTMCVEVSGKRPIAGYLTSEEVSRDTRTFVPGEGDGQP